MHGNIPAFIHITHGKCHDSNALDLISFERNAIYVMENAYVDFEAFNRMNDAGAYTYLGGNIFLFDSHLHQGTT